MKREKNLLEIDYKMRYQLPLDHKRYNDDGISSSTVLPLKICALWMREYRERGRGYTAKQNNLILFADRWQENGVFLINFHHILILMIIL